MGANRIDVPLYLERIGYKGPVEPTLDVLGALQGHHLQAIAFETVASFLRDRVAIDLPALQRKVLLEGRGGYCFELNLLFLHLLRDLGFDARGLTGRVIMDLPRDAQTARTHMLILVTIEGTRYTADVGFGGLSPTGPLRLDTDVEQATPHEPFRLLQTDATYVLEARVAGTWRALYQFDLAPPMDIDYEVANWYVATHPRSPFRGQLMAVRVEPGLRHTLRNSRYALHRVGGASERRELDDPEAIVALLRSTFHLSVPGDPRLLPALSELLEQRLSDPVIK